MFRPRLPRYEREPEETAEERALVEAMNAEREAFYNDFDEENENWEELEREARLRQNLRNAKTQEQKTALARMINPRGPRGVSLKEEIEGAAGLGSPAEFSRFAAYLSAQRGQPLTELNVAPEYALQRGVFNENKYPSAIATGPVPSNQETQRAMQRIPKLVKALPETYRQSPTQLTGLAARQYTNTTYRPRLGLSRTLPKSKAKTTRNRSSAASGGPSSAAAGGPRGRRSRHSRRTRRSRR